MYLLKKAMKSVLILRLVLPSAALKIRLIESQDEIIKNVETLKGPLDKKTVDHLSTICKNNSKFGLFYYGYGKQLNVSIYVQGD